MHLFVVGLSVCSELQFLFFGAVVDGVFLGDFFSVQDNDREIDFFVCIGGGRLGLNGMALLEMSLSSLA